MAVELSFKEVYIFVYLLGVLNAKTTFRLEKYSEIQR